MKGRTVLAALVLVSAAASPALALRGGGGGGGSNGGDREPAGGAFMSSYTAPGSTGIQAYGPPRSVDIPRNGHYYNGERYVPYGYAPRYRSW